MNNDTPFYDSLYNDLDNPNLGLFRRASLYFLYIIDLSENLWRTADFVARRIPNGLIALMLVPLSLLINNVLAAAALKYDLNSTMSFTEPFVKDVLVIYLALGTGWLVTQMAKWLPLSVTLFPTAMELLGSKFAKFGTPAWQIAVWATALFDVITDAPTVAADMAGSWVAWTHNAVGFLGVLGGGPGVWAGAVWYYIVFTFALISASYVVEVLFICSVLVTVMLLMKSVLYWGFGLVVGLLAGRGWSQRVMNFIYKSFGTGEAPPPETGPRAGRREKRRGRRNRGSREDFEAYGPDLYGPGRGEYGRGGEPYMSPEDEIRSRMRAARQEPPPDFADGDFVVG